MKLVVVGFGQCGNRIAEEFSQLNSRARFRRRISILADAFAVNTDSADLSILSSIKSDYRHRILIGNRYALRRGQMQRLNKKVEIPQNPSILE